MLIGPEFQLLVGAACAFVIGYRLIARWRTQTVRRPFLSGVEAFAPTIAVVASLLTTGALRLGATPWLVWTGVIVGFVASAAYLIIRLLPDHGVETKMAGAPGTALRPRPSAGISVHRLTLGMTLVMGFSVVVGALQLGARWVVWPALVVLVVAWGKLVYDGVRNPP